jgi:hypothetical protein
MPAQAFSVLGSTGSIGTQTLDIIAEFPDKFKLVALSAGSNVELLAKQVRRQRRAAAAINRAAAAGPRAAAPLEQGCAGAEPGGGRCASALGPAQHRSWAPLAACPAAAARPAGRPAPPRPARSRRRPAGRAN